MAKVKIVDVINQRIDSLPYSPNIGVARVENHVRGRIMDILADIDEEMVAIRKRKKEQKQFEDGSWNTCWYCGERRMWPVEDGSSWYECYGCGATACKHPTRRHSLPKIHWGGGQFMTPKHLFKPLDPMMWETGLGMARQ